VKSDHIILIQCWGGQSAGHVFEVEAVGLGACRELVRRGAADWYDNVLGKAITDPPADKMIHAAQTKARKRTS